MSVDTLEPPVVAPPVADSSAGQATLPSTPSKAATRRVLHLINGEHYAGAERVQDLLAMRLPDCGVEAAFACLKPDRFPAARRSQQSACYLTPMANRFDLRPARSLARIIRREHFDLIHTHTPRAALVGRIAAAMAGVPLIHHVHGQTATEIGRRITTRLSAMVERRAINGAAAVIAVSPSAGRYIAAHGLAADKVHVVCNGVPSRPVLMSKLPPEGVWTLGVVALFRPRKGLETLLGALSQLTQRGLPVRLRAVGSFENSEYRYEILRRADQLGLAELIEWTGFRANVGEELDQMDLLLFPSVLAEGLPMVVIEAMAAGAPVVGSRVDGVADVIRDEVDGLLCEPGNATTLADAVHRFISGHVDWSAMRQAAWQRQREEFSDRSMARGVAELYRNVLSRRNSKAALRNRS